jgi:hypothetical protein
MRSRSNVLLAALVFTALAALFCLAFPVYVIRPFRAQDPAALSAALFVRRFGPNAALVCALAGAGLFVWVWAASRRMLARFAALALALATVAFAMAARVNVFEIMFHPVDAPSFDTASAAKIDADDMVIAIREGATARAYPIRTMAYHHIVNDRLGGTPVVATY